MSTPPIVSVLMPVYAGERFISRAVESVLSQTTSNIELIIVNDGSPDRSYEAIQPYLSEKRIKYIEQENRGVAAARNTALKQAVGKYIGLCDQDDEWLPHKTQAQVAYLESHPEVHLVHSDVDYIDENGQPLPHDPNFPDAVSGHCFSRLFAGNPIMTVTAMFRRDILKELGAFDPAIKYSDDYDLWLRIASKHKIGYIDAPLARYRWHAANNSHHQVAIREYTLRVLRKAEHDLPEACARLDRRSRDKRYFRLYQQLSRYAIAESRPISSFTYFLRAAAIAPLEAVIESTPKSVRNRIAWYWSRLKESMS